jgi:hypothetical protein
VRLQVIEFVQKFFDEEMVVFSSLVIARGLGVSLGEAYSCGLLDKHHISESVPRILILDQTLFGSVEWTHFGQHSSQTRTTGTAVGPQQKRGGVGV